MVRALNFLANIFPVWVVVFCGLALIEPDWFTWFDKPKIIWGLGVIMLGMGITLSVEDFRSVMKTPRPIAVGFVGQFLIMPFLGWSIATLMGLPTQFAVGLILVSCCPGGTASNVVAYIARANLPLSLLMTMCSTFGAIALTPVLTKLLAGQLMPVDAWGLFQTTAKVVLIPILAGLLLHERAPRLVKSILPVAPLISVITIALICASIIGGAMQLTQVEPAAPGAQLTEVEQTKVAFAESIKANLGKIVLAVGLLHLCAFGLGYGFARLFGYETIIRRTVSIEVGMQNSGLGAVLAKKHFFDPMTGISLAAVPCAISAVFHSVIGSVLAAIWRTRLPKEGAAVIPRKPKGRVEHDSA